MLTLKQKQKIKLQCNSCEKTKISWDFEQEDAGNFRDECKACQYSDNVYSCTECDEIDIPYIKMLSNRGKIQNKCKACDSKGSKKRYNLNATARIAVVKTYAQNNREKYRNIRKHMGEIIDTNLEPIKNGINHNHINVLEILFIDAFMKFSKIRKQKTPYHILVVQCKYS